MRGRAFDRESKSFRRKAAPRPGDWLAEHREIHQSFDAYRRLRQRMGSERGVIALQPIGKLSRRGLIEDLRRYTAEFFAAEVHLLPEIESPGTEQRWRTEGQRRWLQYRTGPILEGLLLPRMNARYACLLGITMQDLYPEPDWNFVFGEASLDERIGVFSLHRLGAPELSPAAARQMLLRRSMQTLAHETGHMFSIQHCIKFECVMNGSNSLPESDRQELVLCPNCLRKLAHCRGFDVLARYRALQAVYRDGKMEDLVAWTKSRLEELQG